MMQYFVSSLESHEERACQIFLSVIEAAVGTAYDREINLAVEDLKTFDQFSSDPKFRHQVAMLGCHAQGVLCLAPGPFPERRMLEDAVRSLFREGVLAGRSYGSSDARAEA